MLFFNYKKFKKKRKTIFICKKLNIIINFLLNVIIKIVNILIINYQIK